MTVSDAVAVTTPQICSPTFGTHLGLPLPWGCMGPALHSLRRVAGTSAVGTCLWLWSAGLILLVLLVRLQ